MDWLNEVTEFARYLPAWTNADGMPQSFKHYIYGSARIRKMHVKEQLRMFDAVNAAGATADSAREWRRERANDAGY